jgi:hypothetical protein
MVVISHDDERVQRPPAHGARLHQSRFKSLGRADGLKDIAAVITAVDHMVNRALVLDSEFTGHAGTNIKGKVCSSLKSSK